MANDLSPVIAELNTAQRMALIRPLMSGEPYVQAHSHTVSALFRRGLVRAGAPRLTAMGEQVAQALLDQYRKNGGRW